MFIEVVRAVLFSCGGTPIHLFVNPPACSGSRSGQLGPDTEYSVATVSRTLGRLNQEYARQGMPSPWGGSDWPCVYEGILHQEGEPMQPPILSLLFLLFVRFAVPRTKATRASS